MSAITLYSKDYCPYCHTAKSLLKSKGLHYIDIDVTHNLEKFNEMVNRSDRTTVPQIFFGDEHVGGSDDLQRYFAKQDKADKAA